MYTHTHTQEVDVVVDGVVVGSAAEASGKVKIGQVLVSIDHRYSVYLLY
jgi:multidrug resistance efflux pump